MLPSITTAKTKPLIAGIDEVGRGPLAGPVVACCVLIHSPSCLKKLKDLGVTDSKKISQKNRRNLLESLGLDWQKLKPHRKYAEKSFSFALGRVDAAKIEKINILEASLLAMKKSFYQVWEGQRCCLRIDGNRAPSIEESEVSLTTIIKGDQKDLAIGLASIIAKEYRDNLMGQYYHKRYPHYGFEKNSGYPTKDHLKALKEWGVTPIHRKTFGPVKKQLEQTRS